MTDRSRPAAFRLNDSEVEIAPPVAAPVPTYSDGSEPVVIEAAPPRRNRWLRLFWTALGTLVSLGFGLAVTRLIDDLFTRAPWLGWVGIAAAGLFVLAGLVLLIREWRVMRQLTRIDTLRAEAAEAIAAKSDGEGGRIASAVLALEAGNARTAQGRAAYDMAVKDHIIDGLDRLRLVEREVLEPLDKQAVALITQAAKRVSVVTAISPRAAVDLAMVFATTAQLVRRIAEIYGGHPGSLGMMRLMRRILTHLALTGGMAAADSVVDQLVGHGLASRLSAKLGEGVLNGLLTARLGVAAMEMCRPLPFIGAPRPNIRDIVGALKGGE